MLHHISRDVMKTNNGNWWPHPSNLRNDRRIKRAMKDFPVGVGYGLIVLLIERLRCEDKFEFPLKDLDLLADEFGVSIPILKTVVKSYSFFETRKLENGDEYIIYSPDLNRLMSPYLQKIENNRIAGAISASKRKQKQSEQIKELSHSNSSIHMFDTCLASVEPNRKEKNRKEKKENIKELSLKESRPVKESYQEFRRRMITEYTNQIICRGQTGVDGNGYEAHVTFSVTSTGYLRNNFTTRDLISEEAIKLWQWLYQRYLKNEIV